MEHYQKEHDVKKDEGSGLLDRGSMRNQHIMLIGNRELVVKNSQTEESRLNFVPQLQELGSKDYSR